MVDNFHRNEILMKVNCVFIMSKCKDCKIPSRNEADTFRVFSFSQKDSALVPTEFVKGCIANASHCERHNYHEFDLPQEYNKNHSPGGIVKVQLGMYYNQLLYLDTASESFGQGMLGSIDTVSKITPILSLFIGFLIISYLFQFKTS